VTGAPRNYSPWRHFLERLATVEPVDPCPIGAPAAEVTAWQARARGRLVQLLEPWPARVPLATEVLSSEDCGSYRRDTIVFDSEAAMSVPAFLLVPHERTTPGPAVLSQHGHGPGKAEVCGIDLGETAADHGHRLADAGYVVLAPDLRAFGKRADWQPPDRYGCDLNHMHLSMLGQTPLALDLWDVARGLDVLAAHPLVDPDRIGMVGLSQGGTMTLFMAAWDARIAAAVVSGYFSSWRASAAVPWNMCGSQVLPGLLGQFEHVDLGALVAPRPLLIQSGTGDPLFPVDVARTEHARLARVYGALGAADRLDHDVFEGGHEWRHERPAAFLDRWLRPFSTQ